MLAKQTLKRFGVLCSLCLVLVLAMMLVACSSTEKAIIGKWEKADGGESIEFFKDGTAIVESEGGWGWTVTANYEFIDDNRISLALSGLFGLAGPQVYEVEISRNQLTLTSTDGTIMEYTKVD